MPYSFAACVYKPPAPLGPEDQGGFRFPPLDPLDSCIPLETTRGKPLDPREADKSSLPSGEGSWQLNGLTEG